MSANTANSYFPHARFLDHDALHAVMEKLQQNPDFQNAVWLELGVGWGRLAVPITRWLAHFPQFGAESCYRGFDKNIKFLTELQKTIEGQSDECFTPYKERFSECFWELTIQDKEVLEKRLKQFPNTNIVIVLASFLSHIPNGLHLLRDNVLQPLLQAGKKVSTVVFQSEKNILTSLLEGSIHDDAIRSHITYEETESNYFSPHLNAYLNFKQENTKNLLPLFQMMDLFYSFKESGNIRRYSMVSRHKITATNLKPIGLFLDGLDFEFKPEYSILAIDRFMEWQKMVQREREANPEVSAQLDPLAFGSWRPRNRENEELFENSTWLRTVFGEWIYQGVMDEGLDAPPDDTLGQFLSYAIFAKQLEPFGVSETDTIKNQLIDLYKVHFARRFTELNSIIINWVGGTIGISEISEKLIRELKRLAIWDDLTIKFFIDFCVNMHKANDPVLSSLRLRLNSFELKETIQEGVREIISKRMVFFVDEHKAALDLAFDLCASQLRSYLTDIWVYSYNDETDPRIVNNEKFSFSHRLFSPESRIHPGLLRRAVSSIEQLQIFLGSTLVAQYPPIFIEGWYGRTSNRATFYDSDMNIPTPPELQHWDEPCSPCVWRSVNGNSGRLASYNYSSPSLGTIIRWLVRGGLGDWLVAGYFSFQDFNIAEEGQWNRDYGVLFPFTSITAHNIGLFERGSRGSKIHFSSFLFDDQYCYLNDNPSASLPPRYFRRIVIKVAPRDATNRIKPVDICYDALGEYLLFEVGNLRTGSKLKKFTAKETLCDFRELCSSNAGKMLLVEFKSDEKQIAFMEALYELQLYTDCWRNEWTYCYYFLDHRLLSISHNRERYLAGLALYSLRMLTTSEQTLCNMLSRQLLSDVATPLAEAQRLEIRTALAEATVLKTTIRQAVHQLNNPLPIVSHWLQQANSLLPTDLSEIANYLQRASHQLKDAQNIVNDFENYVADKPFKNYEKVTLLKLLNLIKSAAAEQFAGIKINFTCNASINEYQINTCAWAMVLVFQILTKNSIMHSTLAIHELNVEIEVETSPMTSASTGMHLLFKYSDNGRGIPLRMRAKLFSPLQTDHPQGTGLGLVIAKKYLLRLGGNITPDYSLKKGACFIITLPTEPTIK